ncbi:MAG TPA: histidine kinase dimerization/phospho-acceptor domain-containing protein [Vicinamibacterales bacterium]|nr:histidine kinase dimerization/phospho-acceptor domain-containing protein [Vicinamibacterales bacterium]
MRTRALLEFTPTRPPAARHPHDLRAEVAQLRVALAEAQAAEARMREGGRAHARRIAHDLNNVLTPMQMSMSLLDEQVKDPDARRLLDMLQGSAQRSVDMVRQILSLSRDVDHQPALDARQLLEDVRRVLAEAFPQSIEVVVEAASDVPGIDADASLTQQTIINLAREARDAMRGGGCLTLRAQAAVIGDQTCVAISVGNTGTGQSTRIMLPARTAAAAGEGLPLDCPHGHGELILIVDRQQSVRTITGQVLAAHGYRVLTAADAAEAVTAFARHSREIDVVLTELTPASSDRAATLDALRTLDADVRLIAVATAIATPFRTETLLQMLRQTLDQ